MTYEERFDAHRHPEPFVDGQGQLFVLWSCDVCGETISPEPPCFDCGATWTLMTSEAREAVETEVLEKYHKRFSV